MKNKSAAVAVSPRCKSEESAKKKAPAKNKNPITYFIVCPLYRRFQFSVAANKKSAITLLMVKL